MIKGIKELHDWLKAHGIEPIDRTIKLADKPELENLVEEVKKYLDAGGTIKIIDGKICKDSLYENKYIEQSTDSISKELDRLNSEGIEVDIIGIVNTVREEAEAPMFSMLGSTEITEIHITSKNLDDIVYIVSKEEADSIIAKCSDAEASENSKKSMLQFILEEGLSIRTNAKIHGYYVTDIEKNKKEWIIKASCLVDEDGNLLE